MTRSTKLRALAIVAIVVSASCNSESDQAPQKESTKSSRERSSKPKARSPAGGQAEAVDGGAADGVDAAVAPSEIAADAEVGDGAAPAQERDGGNAEATAGASTSGPAKDDKPANQESGATERGPYFDSGTWHGYLWISHHAEGTTIATTNFSDATFRERTCIQGSVAATPDSSGNAMLGLNINQAHRTDAPTLTVVPSGAGVQVAVTNPGASPLRIQVHAPDGATNGDARWCAMVNGAGGFVPWTQFNTACWDGSGKPYRREPISAALLLVPGNTATPVPYDFCLLDLREADAAP